MLTTETHKAYTVVEGLRSTGLNKSEADRTATVPSSINFSLRVQKLCSWNTRDEGVSQNLLVLSGQLLQDETSVN